ncbi:hypothetical protein CWE12_01150 [Aliidiomarina sedimenti]|uniref:Response regulatory domain-containing protein n=1 Tax=Aliidiomarina sedimenti TaxID=1933879 RepID=A0ABY0C1H7_9GAMM|nr:response regulator [Aliidiomarina sedimenti]RUO31636.1 hypothetical protein CWE12_01150 [Aliidiomarina sedimenti]
MQSQTPDNKQLDCLILTDSNGPLAEVRDALHDEGLQTRCADSLSDFQRQSSEQVPDLVLIDLDLQGQRVSASDELLSFKEENPGVPCFMLSERGDFKSRLAAVRAGASFFFQAPLNTAQLIEKIRQACGQSEPSQRLIVVLEDEPVQADLYGAVLKSGGFNVVIADDPEQALQYLLDNDAGLLITDVHLPKCSGLEFGQLLRQHEALADLPILFMSNDTAVDIKLAALSIAFDEFITKPIEPWRLLMIVEARMMRLYG